MQTLVTRAERLRAERIDPHEDNMLKITTDGRKAALDMRLIDPTLTPGPDSKVAKAGAEIFRIWRETRATRRTQLVFIDLSTPDPHRWNVYDEVRTQLLQRGVPENEIAFIHHAETDNARKLLFEAVNAGRIRILLGSTEKMGAGTNVQQRLIALHHLDICWRPRDVEQREGRILRQGNTNPEVWIYRYVTESSFDAYMWQVLEVKARFIAQVMTGDVGVRTAEDVENAALTYAEIKAIASGNPLVVEKIKVDTELRRLDQLQALHRQRRQSIQWAMSALPSRIAEAEAQIRHLQADLATRDSHPTDPFEIAVGTKLFTGKDSRKQGAEALTGAILSWKTDPAGGQRGSFRGFEIWSRGKNSLSRQLDNELPDVYLLGRATYHAHLNADTPLGTLLSIEHALHGIEKHIETEHNRLADLNRRLGEYRAELAQPFQHEKTFQSLLARQAELAAALDLDKADRQTAVAAENPEDTSEEAV